MSEEFSAGESATPADSQSSNVDTASTGAGQQHSTVDANASTPPDAQIDIGWSFEDKPEDPAAIPENDDDIEELAKDPLLDQARTPGLVTELRNARALAKESKRQAAELKQQLTQLEQFGGMEGVSQAMGLVNGLLTNPEQGTTDFLGALYQQSYPSYEQLVNNVITANADYAIELLQQAGRLPVDFTQRRGGSVDLTGIPESLHATANNLTADEWAEFDELQTEQARLGFLNRVDKLNRLDTNQRQQAEQSWRQQVGQAHQQGQESLQKLSSQYETAHYTELAKWKPLGPDNEPGNQTIYKMAVEGAMADLLSDQKFAQMYQDAFQLISNAPQRRLRNESFAADADERKGRQLGAQVNTRLGQLLRERVKLLDGVFRDARAYREQQRQSAPERREISGISSTASNGSSNGASALDESGNISEGYMNRLVEKMKGWRG